MTRSRTCWTGSNWPTRLPEACPVALVGTVAVFLCGCAVPSSQDPAGAASLPALGAPSETIREMPSDQPSVYGHDRTDWGILLVGVTTDRVRHQPTYVVNPAPGPPYARRVGLHPTALSALEIERDAEGLWAAGMIGCGYGQIGWAPVEMIAKGRWPWTIESSPDRSFQRLPEHHRGIVRDPETADAAGDDTDVIEAEMPAVESPMPENDQ